MRSRSLSFLKSSKSVLRFALFAARCSSVVDRFLEVDFANGHTSSNTPDPIRTRKLSGERPGQYWGGGPPGKPLGCCWLFVCASSSLRFEFKIGTRTKRRLRERITSTQTLSQNGYGDNWSAPHLVNRAIDPFSIPCCTRRDLATGA